MPKFVKKPIEVEAFHYTFDSPNFRIWRRKMRFIDWFFKPHDSRLWIITPEGEFFVSQGDWIIKGIQGEFYPCKPDIFEKTYSPVEE